VPASKKKNILTNRHWNAFKERKFLQEYPLVPLAMISDNIQSNCDITILAKMATSNISISWALKNKVCYFKLNVRKPDMQVLTHSDPC
jgi:hypothetical protein